MAWVKIVLAQYWQITSLMANQIINLDSQKQSMSFWYHQYRCLGKTEVLKEYTIRFMFILFHTLVLVVMGNVFVCSIYSQVLIIT